MADGEAELGKLVVCADVAVRRKGLPCVRFVASNEMVIVGDEVDGLRRVGVRSSSQISPVSTGHLLDCSVVSNTLSCDQDRRCT